MQTILCWGTSFFIILWREKREHYECPVISPCCFSSISNQSTRKIHLGALGCDCRALKPKSDSTDCHSLRDELVIVILRWCVGHTCHFNKCVKTAWLSTGMQGADLSWEIGALIGLVWWSIRTLLHLRLLLHPWTSSQQNPLTRHCQRTQRNRLNNVLLTLCKTYSILAVDRQEQTWKRVYPRSGLHWWQIRDMSGAVWEWVKPFWKVFKFCVKNGRQK